MITVWIDRITPCLRDVSTGDIVETEVIRLRRKSFLQKYNKKTGWYTNWSQLVPEFEVYALVLKGTVDIQGLIALTYDDEAKATFVSWMCANPESNPLRGDEKKKYEGIGGHLFAIAIDKSLEFGTNGEFYGFAADSKLLNHYCESFGAIPVCQLHKFHFVLPSESASEIKRTYTYDWTQDEI